MTTIPTVSDLLRATAIGNGFHDWAVAGGAIRITKAALAAALEEAYDPSMPNWPAMVEIDDA